MTKKPSISIILVCYNHESFVAEALRSWMEQDYPEYEIVIADDASSDGTRAVIAAELAGARRPGVRVVECNQVKNVGLIGNINAAMAACSGDVIVAAAGDDVADPMRLRYAAEIFENDPSVFAVVANCTKVDALGRVLKSTVLHHEPGSYSYATHGSCVYAGAPVCGASTAYRAELFRRFGPMRPGTHGEDNCYLVRALLLGAVFFDPRPLVRWRQHGANLSNYANDGFVTPESRQRYLRFLRAHELMGFQWETDVALALERGWVSPAHAAKVLRLARTECTTHALNRCSLGAADWREWTKAAWQVLRMGRWNYVRRKFWLRLNPWKRSRVWRRLAKEIG